MRRKTAGWAGGVVLLAGIGAVLPLPAMGQVVFYSESFDSAARTSVSSDPSVNTGCAVGNRVTDNPPPGWTVNDCGVRTFYCREGLAGGACPATGSCGGCGADAGIVDWEGWAFADRVWWGSVDPQGRQNFTLSTGNCAVADPDEWDDEGDPASNCGKYNALMSSPLISISAADAGSLEFRFDSSWRPEGFDELPDNNQTARIRAVYRVGGIDQPPVTVLLWDSNPQGSSFKPDAENESVTISNSALQIPAGATHVRFEFGLLEAANDWWWAIDNLSLIGTIASAPQVFFAEGFDGVTLQPPQEEGVGGCAAQYCGLGVYTHTGPNGVSVTVDPVTTGGVADWNGWSFAEVAFWNCVSGQNRGLFALGDGAVAIADGDEWTDTSPNSGTLNTTLRTPSISISGRTSDILVLQFDSSWRDEPNQVGRVYAEYNSGGTVLVREFSSDPASQSYKATNYSERIFLPLYVPAGASSVVIRFDYIAGNNWWWALDDLRVFEGEASITLETETPFVSQLGLAPTYDFDPCFAPWAPDPPAGWTESPFTGVNGVEEWRGWSFAWNEWWYTNVADQGRSLFQLGDGFVAVADADEWDDAPNGQTFFNSFITSPAIPVPGSFTTATLEFDSSWQYEGFDDAPGNTNNQTATIVAQYTVGGVPQPPVEILRWDSDDDDIDGLPSPFFKPDAPNEHVTLSGAALQIPAGATSVRLEFGLSNARNDWWWAVDDLKLSFDGATAFLETFENPTNGQTPPSEPLPTTLCAYWSTAANQNTGYASVVAITGCDEAASADWYGFNAWLTDAWSRSAPGDLRSDFPSRTAYVSDFKRSGCDGSATLTSPVFNIGGINAGTLAVSFRSGFFAEAGHLARVEVSYNGGATWTTALTWDADAPLGNPARKTTNTNELVSVNLSNPAGATAAQIRFVDSNSGWWAISDITLTATVGQSAPTCAADFNGNRTVSVQDIYDFLTDWNSQVAGGPVVIGSANFNGVGGVTVQDLYDFLTAWNTDITGGFCN